MRLLVLLALAQPAPPPPTQPPVRVVAVDGGYTLTVSCANCSGGGGGSSSGGLVYVADAGVLNVNPVAISSAPPLNIADAGVLNVNPHAVTQGTSPWVVSFGPATIADAGVLNVNPVAIASLPVAFIQDAGVLNVNPVAIASVPVLFIGDAGALNVNPIAVASMPTLFIADAGTLNINLPPGAATSARQDTGNTSLANLDVLLSTRTKPADQQHVIIDTSASTAVTGTFWQTTQPVSADALPLPTGAATDATLSGLLDGGVGLLSAIAANQTSGNQLTQITIVAHPLNPFLPRCNPVRRTGCQP